ncbi:MAG: hypothetical protein WBV23_11850 [Desulfobaccales bacterium]
MKLFLTGDLITPIAFYRWKGKWYEAILHGENYGLGYDLSGKPYIFNVDDIEAFDLFRSQINRYLSFMNFYDIPYLKRQKAFNNIDLRCSLAIHLYLKRSIEDNNSFIIFDKLIDYTIALESLYLNEKEKGKGEKLSRRISTLLSKDDSEKGRINEDIKYFYEIRGDIVHASLIDQKGEDFLSKNICKYENILRKSILAFLDLNLSYKTKKDVLSQLDQAISNPEMREKIHDSLEILKLAR